MNYKRKSRRRFFLLVRSRTPPISSEFRGGGLNTPNPPPRYATVRTSLQYLVAPQAEFAGNAAQRRTVIHVGHTVACV